MNPIEFCRQPGYHSTMFLTYSFDPLFFERLVLPTLRASGTGTTLVVADKNQLNKRDASWAGQLVQLGKRYQLFGMETSGSFHPKIIVRIGKGVGAVWIGSANITFAGWSVNRELGTAWRFGPGRPDSGGWLPTLLDHLSNNGVSEVDYMFMDRVNREGWLSDLGGSSNDTATAILTTFGGRTLAAQLEERWSGRRFSSVRILTGSTDTRGAWLNQLHEFFGVEDALVLADRGRCGFISEEIARLPISIEVSSAVVEGSNPLHAKFFWFEGPDGPAAVFGSANCSAAAWLLPQTGGGNHESIVVYDAPDQEEFADVLAHFDGELAPIDLNDREQIDVEPPETSSAEIKIFNASWRDSSSPLVVRFDRPVSESTEVVAILADTSVPLEPTHDLSVWISSSSIESTGVATSFIVVSLHFPGSERIEIDAWVNDYAELRQSEQGDDIDASLGNMGRARTTSEQREILKRLQQVSSAILRDTDLFSDPQYISTASKKAEAQREEAASAPSIDPNELVRSLGELSERDKQSNLSSTGKPGQLTLLGVMRALYDVGQQDLIHQESDYDEQWDDADLDSATSNTGSGQSTRSGAVTLDRDDADIDEKFKERLRKQTGDFLERLGTREFADATSATQLVQAASYPLALSVISVRDKWATIDSAQEWCRRAFDTLFRQEYPRRCRGLIEHVALRYKEEGESQSFDQIVGDGTLWFALLSSVDRFSWNGPAGSIDRAFVLRDIFRSRNLVASADIGRLRTLISKDQQLQLKEVLEYAPKIDQIFSRLEALLASKFDEVIENQLRDKGGFQPSDLMWSQKGGWGVLSDAKPPGPDFLAVYLHKRADERFVKNGFFVDVTLAAKTDASLASCLEELTALGATRRSTSLTK